MEELLNGLVSKCGIDKATAEKVIDFLKEHASDVSKFIADRGLLDKLPGGLGDTLGKLL